mgnify:CR=1 FL=1
MCEYCNDKGLIYADRGIGIEVKKCPMCDRKDDEAYMEFKKWLTETKRQLERVKVTPGQEKVIEDIKIGQIGEDWKVACFAEDRLD